MGFKDFIRSGQLNEAKSPKVGDTVLVNKYDENGRLPARAPKGVIVRLPEKGASQKRWLVKLSASKKEVEVAKNEFEVVSDE